MGSATREDQQIPVDQETMEQKMNINKGGPMALHMHRTATVGIAPTSEPCWFILILFYFFMIFYLDFMF